MEKKDNEIKIEEINLWPLPGGKYKKARVFSYKGKIYQIDIEDPRTGTISLHPTSFFKLMRFLSGRNFAGVAEKLIVK